MPEIAARDDSASPPNVARRDSTTVAGGASADGEAPLAFGRFRLFPLQRRLSAGDEPIELGSRTFELLLALVEAHGNVMTKQELRTRVWPCTVVDDHNIDVHVSLLRKALGSDRDMIRTEAGRGYRFVAVVSPVPGAPPTNLPAPISQLVGREHELAELQDLIAAHRLLTLAGSGGIGKTRLGLEAARLALPRFPDGAWVVELGPLVDPGLVPGAIALVLGVEPGSSRSVVDQLVAVLSRKRLLLVLDNCEHVIEAAALTAETLLSGVPGLHVLATSQEPLAAAGEHIYPVRPLKVPPTEIAGAAQALEHSAVQLFVERAQAANPLLALDDAAAAAVSQICRHLDGIPLAIELAAARAATMGVEAVARRLDDRFRLLTGGRRKALRRHQTLRAALDWSYGLLEDAERAVLRRLAIFAGSFALDSAGSVAAADGIDELQAANHVADLVRKSLLTFEAHGATARYRLLDTTRAYALEKLAESGEFDAVARRHAEHYRDLLERAEAHWQTTRTPELVAQYAPEIDNIRAALDWAFEPGGDPEMGVALVAVSVPLWTLLSILPECLNLVHLALSHLNTDDDRHARYEMLLQTALATSSSWKRRAVDEAYSAATRALELAERLREVEYQLRALYLLWVHHLSIGQYRTTLGIAKRFKQLTNTVTDVPASLTAARLEGVSLSYLGEYPKAKAAFAHVLDPEYLSLNRSFVVRFGIDQRIGVQVCIARIRWLQGFPDQAAGMARASLEEAQALNHVTSLCLSLSFGVCNIAALADDLDTLEQFAPQLTNLTNKHALGMWQSHSLAFKAWIATKHGDAATAIRILATAIASSQRASFELHQTIFVGTMARALAATGRVDDALMAVNKAIDESNECESYWCVPELLRLRAMLTLRQTAGITASTAAKNDLREAIDLAHRQGARSWQLRAATDLAGLLHRHGQTSEARAVLMPIFDSFTEGFNTSDFKAAATMIESFQ